MQGNIGAGRFPNILCSAPLFSDRGTPVPHHAVGNFLSSIHCSNCGVVEHEIYYSMGLLSLQSRQRNPFLNKPKYSTPYQG